MDDVYVFFVKLPPKVAEMVTVGPDGYSVYIDSDLSDKARLRAYKHALRHILNNDFAGDDVQTIEQAAHDVQPDNKDG